MTRDDIIRMAREAGATEWCPGWHISTDELERFAHLVASHEREACALVCDAIASTINGTAYVCRLAIRARIPKSPEDLNPGDDYA
jgi:hypothetical protein